MPAYLCHVTINTTLRLHSVGYDEGDAAANAETLALAIMRSQFDKAEADDAEVTCVEVVSLDPDGSNPEGPQG